MIVYSRLKFLFLSILTGLLLTFSFPNLIQKDIFISTSFFIWFAYVPLFYVIIKETSIKRAFFYSYISSNIFYLLSLYWLIFVKPMGFYAYIAWISLSLLYLSLIFSLSVALTKYIFNKYNIDFIILFPILITLSEYIREWLFTGFPLLIPAQSQHNFTAFIQIIKITGNYGANFFIICVNIIILKILLKEKIFIKKLENILFVILFVALFVLIIISNFEKKSEKEYLTVGILQSNNDQSVNWDQDYKQKTMQIYKKLIFNIKDKIPDLIIWPETGYPGILNLEKNAGKNIAKLYYGVDVYHLIGSDKAVKNKNGTFDYYNTAFLIGPDGKILDDYEKYHLVPFGEYIPFHNLFPFIDKVVRRYGYISFKSGKKLNVLKFKNIKTGALICYDSMFPEISRTFIKNGADFLSHLSYETWYGDSCASAQIFTNLALRAVENNVYIARCVESGISGIINNKGKIIYKTKLFEQISFTGKIYYEKNKNFTFYTRFGNWFIYFISIVFILIILIRRKNVNFNK